MKVKVTVLLSQTDRSCLRDAGEILWEATIIIHCPSEQTQHTHANVHHSFGLSNPAAVAKP